MIVNVKCVVNSFEQSLGQVQLHPYSLTKRLFKAALLFAIGFAAAFMGALVPMLHFVLVPSLVGLAMWLAWRAYGARYKIMPIELYCPQCKENIKNIKGAGRLPHKMICPSCGIFFTINSGETGL